MPYSTPRRRQLSVPPLLRRPTATLAFAAGILLVWQFTLTTHDAESAVSDLLGVAPTPTLWAALATVVFGATSLAWLIGVLGLSPAQAGLGVGRLGRHVAAYLGLCAIMLAITLGTSFAPSFERVYPLAPTGGPLWFLTYGGALFATEVFFRGLLLFPFVPALGRGAALVGVIPYVLVHAHKPPIEAAGALAAGLVLSWLALSSRSLWGGVALHVVVAFTMEIAAV